VSATTVDALVVIAVAAPALALGGQAVALWFGWRPPERVVVLVVTTAFGTVTATQVVLAAAMWLVPRGLTGVRLGTWFTAGHYAWHWRLVTDTLSVTFVLLTAALITLTAALSSRYLHREPGFCRFFLLLTLFGTGVDLAALAGSLPILFFGWELVGLSSALLIAFFHERRGPVRNGLRAFLTYRFCDVGLLAAILLLGDTTGTVTLGGNAGSGTGQAGWAQVAAPTSTASATWIALLLTLAVVGKSALVPASGWLPRAMEGPTPSSAIFYGAISVHLGPYLLLRTEPVLRAAPAARGVVIALGLLTALHATLVGRAQADIKSVLAYASMAQVGLIVAEIGFGLRYLALLHIVGHAAVRSAQILRSPSLLHDRHHLEQVTGQHPRATPRRLVRLVPPTHRSRLYRHVFHEGNLDPRLRQSGRPVLRALRAVDAWQQRAADLIGGAPGREITARPPGPADGAGLAVAGLVDAGRG
jgi:NADH:ubiquinone oxidoreductase subunit 5 (subunit L)/multisubunit Na+/H+ antiporter MnhA subunit